MYAAVTVFEEYCLLILFFGLKKKTLGATYLFSGCGELMKCQKATDGKIAFELPRDITNSCF